MKSVDHASFSTIRKFVRDVLGESVSRGYLRKVVAKASAALDAPYAELLGRLPLEQAINVDETGHKDNGGKFWTWVFRAELYVLFKIDKTRGSKVLLDVLGEEFDGVLGCDYFSAYHKYMSDFNITVQFCIAHLIRDIKFLAGLPDAETCAYGQRLLAAVKAMFKVIHRRGETDPAAFRRALEQARDRILEEALRDVPSRLDANGKELKREAFNIQQPGRASRALRGDRPAYHARHARAQGPRDLRTALDRGRLPAAPRHAAQAGHLRHAGPVRLRVHPRGGAGALPQRTRALPVARLGLMRPAPPPQGRRADRIVRAERRDRVSGSSKRASKCGVEVLRRSVDAECQRS